MTVNPDNLFGVVRRVVPAHGIKIGCTTENVANALRRDDAYRLADALQAKNPNEEYAVIEVVFHRWTKPESTT